MDKNYKTNLVGDCRNEDLVKSIFGSVSEFARQVELNGNEFTYGEWYVRYSTKDDRHLFYYKGNK